MSTIGRIAHIGIAVKSIAEAERFYVQGLGIELDHTEDVPEQGVKVAFLPTGESELELLEPLSEASPVAKFLEKRGEGIHHICLEVADIEAALSQLAAQGAELIDKAPRRGAEGKRVAFIHPRSAHGVLIELVEKA
ncbi:MAG: methylmalonyl-CoA epimerase [Chloroflexi bacterium]|nr:methylmalonyl-CoA epimerase [Chloroflexota bacterium]